MYAFCNRGIKLTAVFPKKNWCKKKEVVPTKRNTTIYVIIFLSNCPYLFKAITFLMTKYMDKNTASNVTVSSKYVFSNF